MTTDDTLYECERCNGIFTKGRSDEEAGVEMKNVFGASVKEAKHAVVCDDCFKEMMLYLSLIH